MPFSTLHSPQYLIVAGVMRSGTTLLYRLLNNHPQVQLTYEMDVFALTPLLWPSWEAGAWHKRLDFWNGALRRHGLDAREITERLPAQVSDPGQAFTALADAYHARKPATYVGDKSIHFHDLLPAIAGHLPDARFVVLHRPIADIIDSVRRAGPSNHYLTPARRRRLLFQRYTRMLEGVVALRRANHLICELHYPELIKEPEAACRQVCDFLGLPFAPEMLESNLENITAIPEARHHFNARHAKVGEVPLRQADPLPPKVNAKVMAYEEYWAKRFAGQPVRLAPRSALSPGSALRFFPLRRRIDRLFYEIHHLFFHLKLFLYRYAPLSWLRRYRAYAGYDPNGGRLGRS